MRRTLSKFIIFILTVTLIISLGIGFASAKTEVFEIYDATDFSDFATKINSGERIDGILKNDIILNGSTDFQLGNYNDSVAFRDTFDGNGFEISGLNIDSAETYCGLFGYVYGGTIKNLNLSGKVTSTEKYPSALIGLAKGNVTVSNCTVDINLNFTTGGDATGGLFFAVVDNDSKIAMDNCCAYGEIITDGAEISGLGGFCGNVRGTSTVNMEKCLSHVDFCDKAEETYSFFRVAGGDGSNIHCTDCYFVGDSQHPQGITLSENEMKNGEICYNLGENYGQLIGTDERPTKRTDNNIVYKITYTGDLSSTSYTNGEVIFPTDKNKIFNYRFLLNGEEYLASSPINSDLTLTVSRSTDKIHTVTFIDGNDEIIKQEKILVGTVPEFPATPSYKDGYSFVGWYIYGEKSKSAKKWENSDFDCGNDLTLISVFTVSEALIDADNSTGVSYWDNLSLKTKTMAENGYSGDGCQWPSSVEFSDSGKVAFFGTDVAGAFRSIDGGKNWKYMSTGITSRGVGMFAIDPINENHVLCIGSGLVAASGGFYYSEDCGDTWEKTQNIATVLARYHKDGFEFDKTSYDEDKGICMTAYFSTPYEEDTGGVAIDAETKTILTDETAGLYKSTDGGRTFTRINGDIHDCIIEVNPQTGRIYAANKSGLFISDDGGYSFSTYYDGKVNGLDMIEYQGDVRVYFSTDDAIYYSFDGCETDYNKINSVSYFNSGRVPKYITVSPVNPKHMVITARTITDNYYVSYTYYSLDGGITFDKSNVDTSTVMFGYNARERWYTFSPTEEGVFLTFGGDTCLRSDDAGKTLTGVNGISDIMLGGRFAFNIYNPDYLYFGAQDYGGAATTDGGETWVKCTFGGNTYGAYAASDKVFFGGASPSGWSGQQYVGISFDGGKTQTVTDYALDSSIIGNSASCYQSANDPDILFCGNLRSTDMGVTWNDMDDCLCVYTHNPIGQKELYGSSKDHGYAVVSYDDGETWTKINKEKMSVAQISDIAVDYINNKLYVTTNDRLIEIYLDGTHKDITALTPTSKYNNSFNRGHIKSVCVDNNNPNIVYACGSGDFFSKDTATVRSCDGGKTWYAVTSNTRNTITNSSGESGGLETTTVRVNPNNGILLAGSACYGFFTLTPPYDLTGNQAKTFTITFDTNTNEKINPVTIHYSQKITAPFEPKREGYVFSDWYSDSEYKNKFDFSTEITEETHLYAKWVEAVKLSFCSRGEIFKVLSVAKGGKAEYPKFMPVEEGYSFAGWYTDYNCTKKFDESTTITKDMKLYAGYYVNQFNLYSKDIAAYISFDGHYLRTSNYNDITYVSDRTSVSNRVAVIDVSPNTTYTITLNMNCRFRGGSVKDIEKGMVVKNFFIDELDDNSSNFINKERTITFKTGEEDTKLLLFYFSNVSPRDCTATKYTISVCDESSVTNAAEIKNHTISFIGFDGNIIHSTVLPLGEVVSYTAPTVDGYDFLGWNKENGKLSEIDFGVEDDISITAVYKQTEQPTEPSTEPDLPDGPEKPSDNNCSCICHSTNGFMQFIYKIVLIFWKLFGTNKVCDCGISHY